MLKTFSFGTFLRVPLGCWSEFVVASYQSLWGDAGQQATGDTSLLLWGNLYKCCCSLSKLLPLQSETGIRFHSRWRYTVDFCWVLSLSVSGGISKCNNSFHQVPLLLQYLFKMWQQWQRHEHYRWEAREKKNYVGNRFLVCDLSKKKKSVLLKDLHVGTLIVVAGPQTRWLMYCTKTNKQWFISASTLLNILWWKPFVAVGVTLLSNLKARN